MQLRAHRPRAISGYARTVHRPIRILHDVGRVVRMRVAAALGKLCAREVTAPLLMQLRDENPDVRKHAIAAPTDTDRGPCLCRPPW